MDNQKISRGIAPTNNQNLMASFGEKRENTVFSKNYCSLQHPKFLSKLGQN
jgi:hypothetical protein